MTSGDLGVGPSASEQTGEDYRPVTNWVYRGAMNPEFIRQHDQDEHASDDQKQSEDIERMAGAAGGAQESSAQGQRNREGHAHRRPRVTGLPEGGSCPPMWKNSWP